MLGPQARIEKLNLSAFSIQSSTANTQIIPEIMFHTLYNYKNSYKKI